MKRRHSFRKARQISRAEWKLLFNAAFKVALARGALWIMPLERVRRLVAKHRAQGAPDESVERIVWAVSVASRYIPSATCLVQAVAAQTLLTQHGIVAQLHVGVALSDNGQFQAHAWIEHEGRIVIGGVQSNQYRKLLVLE